ncbi:MAG: serine O-acetyltransferase [Planctomycetota bacterium]|nr:serine O-acetyltransferase [Planctomycetota bacterium]
MSGTGRHEDLARRLVAPGEPNDRIQHLSGGRLPNRDVVLWILEQLQYILFPGFFGPRDMDADGLAEYVATVLAEIEADLQGQVEGALRYQESIDASNISPEVLGNEARCAAEITSRFLEGLPELRRLLSLDVQAAYDGDPAAQHTDEAVLCYPGIKAITVHRIAHELYIAGVPLIPRIMHEWAHSETGIDIHPGATIGEGIFIDHGTGVVIGETTVIGNGCKIYQGVTLGAKSFPKDERGRLKRGVKRHPTLEDEVTVYAGATILGGDTVIGYGSVVNGGVFLTNSIPANHVAQAPVVEVCLKDRSGG